jgi:hypothetical protein
VRIRIEGSDLPGRRVGPAADALRLNNVHVGVQRLREAVDLVPASAPEAAWEFEVAAKRIEGLLDVGGPFVHGRPGARFLYLSWGNVDGPSFAMFRRAKLMFGDIPGEALLGAYDGGLLVGSLGLTDAFGDPVCARVKPPAIAWTLR